MNRDKFEYFLNAVHYCLYLGEKTSNLKVNMWVTKIMWFLSKIFSFEDYYKTRKEKIEKDKDLNEFMYGKNAGFSIGWAHHWFGYFYSCYSGLISFIAFGIYLYFFHEVNKFILCVLIFTPVLLCFIPAQKAVFKDDRYLRYFKKFEKEDELWHKKWRKITIAFCVGGVFITILGIVLAFVIAISGL